MCCNRVWTASAVNPMLYCYYSVYFLRPFRSRTIRLPPRCTGARFIDSKAQRTTELWAPDRLFFFFGRLLFELQAFACYSFPGFSSDELLFDVDVSAVDWSLLSGSIRVLDCQTTVGEVENLDRAECFYVQWF